MQSHLKNILIGAAITAFLIIVIGQWALPAKFCITYGCDSKVLVLLMILVNIFAGLPGLLWLLKKQVPHAISISLFAIVEAFWLAFALVPALVPIGWWPWAIAASVLLIIAYFLAYLLFVKWAVRFRYRVLVAISTVLITAIVCDRLPLLF